MHPACGAPLPMAGLEFTAAEPDGNELSLAELEDAVAQSLARGSVSLVPAG